MSNHLIQQTLSSVKHKLALLAHALLKKEGCAPGRFILSCCTGVFIAFSPFIGFHTAMVFLFGWLFSLNVPLMFAVSCGINNPLTMIPIYTLDYIVGQGLFNALGIHAHAYNPSLVIYLNELCTHHLGIQGLAFWPFIIGGNLLALAMSGMLYPILTYIFYRYSTDNK